MTTYGYASSLVQTNQVANNLLAKYKDEYESGYSLSASYLELNTQCKKQIEHELVKCSSSCGKIEIETAKKSIANCIAKYVELNKDSRVYRSRLLIFQNQLKNGNYSFLPKLKEKLEVKLLTLIEDSKSLSSATSHSIESYQKLFGQIILAEYAEARQKGIVQGKIIGLCSHLKNSKFKFDALVSGENYYTSSFDILGAIEKLKAYQQLSQVLRASCPDLIKPADYSTLISQLKSKISHGQISQEVAAKCRSPHKNEYVKRICSNLTIQLDTYSVNILAQDRK